VIVKFSPRARRRVKLVSSWWRSNRQAAPMLFDEELEQAVVRLKTQPTLGAEYQTVEGEVVRRLLLPRTQQHVYYGDLRAPLLASFGFRSRRFMAF
jgi:hypothetical protein